MQPGCTALFSALRDDHLDVAEALLAAGADVDIAAPAVGRVALRRVAWGGPLRVLICACSIPLDRAQGFLEA